MKRLYTFLFALVISVFAWHSASAQLELRINNRTQTQIDMVGSDPACVGIVSNFFYAVSDLSADGYTIANPAWSGSGAAYIDDPNASFISFNASVAGDYELIFTASQTIGGITTVYSITQYITVFEPDNLFLDFPDADPYVVCEDTPLTFQASGTTKYIWKRVWNGSNIGSSPSVVEMPPGVGTWKYSVNGFNEGCPTIPAKIEFNVEVEEAAQVDAGGSYGLCVGKSVVLNGSIGGSATSAEWIGGLGTFTPNRNALNASYTPHPSEAGTTVQLLLRTNKPSASCDPAEDQAEITVHDLPTVSETFHKDVSCFGGSDGEFTIEGSGYGSVFTYSLDGKPFVASGVFSGLEADSYTVTVENEFGCSDDIVVIITQPASALGGSITLQKNLSCHDKNDGEVTVEGTGGTSPYSYRIDGGSYQASGLFAGLDVGLHHVDIMDSNGCEFTVPVTITAPAPISISSYIVTSIVDQNGCYGDADGEIEVTATGGTPDYVYSLYNGGTLVGTQTPAHPTSAKFTGLVASDAYRIEVTDANTCAEAVQDNIQLIEPDELTGSITDQEDVKCFGESTGSVTVSAMGGTSPYQYSLNGGAYQASSTFAGLDARTHTVTIRDANGCLFDVPVTITQPALPLSIVLDDKGDVNCFGGSDGWITVEAAGGTAPYEYSRNDGAFGASPTFTDLAQGSYKVTVRDINGCTEDLLVSITQPASALGGSITLQKDLSCHDKEDGEVTVEGTGGTSPYSYRIDGGSYQASGLFAGLDVGLHNVDIMDANGCEFSVPVSIISPDPIEIDSYSITSIVDLFGCYGDEDGIIEVLAKGGTPNFKYSLFDGGTLIETQQPVHPTPALFINLKAGDNYRIEVTDASDCTSAEITNIVIAQPDELRITDIDFTDASCYGENNGTITITAEGGTGDLIYSVNTGGPYVPNSVFNVESGIYDIWVMDENGCKAEWHSNPIFIDEPEKIVYDYKINSISTCYGAEEGSIIISNVRGGAGDYEYSITEPPVWGTDPVFENLPGGATNRYYIRVKDKDGCIVTANNGDPIIIDEPDEITFNYSTIDITGCWYSTNGAITISNVNGGTGVKWVSVDDGEWRRVANPTAVITFVQLGVGQHVVKIRDRNNGANACEVSVVIDLTGPPPIVVTDATLIDNECYGHSTGVAIVTATGGTGSFTYTLYLDGNIYAGPQASNIFPNLIKGDYVLDIVDDNNCVLPYEFTIDSPEELELTTAVTDILCSDAGDVGEISAIAIGGNAPYTIILTKGGVEVDSYTNVDENEEVVFTGLAPAANYRVVVQDAKHPTCAEVISADLEVYIPDPLVFNNLTLVVEDLECNGVPTGTITIAGQGGTLPYTYTLLDENGDQVGLPVDAADNSPVTFSDLAAGTYTVTIDDDHGCGPVSSAAIVVTEPDVLEIDNAQTVKVDISCFGADDGEITVVGIGGTGDLTYTLLQNGDPVLGFVPQVNNGTFTNLTPGVYVVEVNDVNNCGPAYSNDIEIEEPEAIEIAVEDMDAANTISLNCFGDIIDLNVLASKGTAPYTYYLYDEFNNLLGTQLGNVDDQITFVGIAAGQYTIEVEDANGCTMPLSLEIVQPDEVLFDSNIITQPFCSPDGTSGLGEIASQGKGGVAPYLYILYVDESGSFVELDQNNSGLFTDLLPGDYRIVLTDSHGCGTDEDFFTINSPTNLEIDHVVITDIDCFGDPDGELEIVTNGATGTVYYSILPDYNGDGWVANNKFTGLPAGDYTVMVKDDNHCIITQTVTISESPQLVVSLTGTPPNTSLDSDGFIQATVTGGTPNYWYQLYKWNEDSGNWDEDVSAAVNDTPDTERIFSNLGVGVYRVVVTDALNCEASEGIALTQFTITLAATDLDCNNVCDGTITVTAYGGAIATITWTLDGEPYDMDDPVFEDANGKQYENLCAGTYVAVAADANGVESTASIVISQPDAIVIDNAVAENISCFGIGDGKITVEASGGTGTLVYTLIELTEDPDNPEVVIATQPDGEFTNLVEGSYRVDITDDNACGPISSDVFDITEPQPIAISVDGLDENNDLMVNCNGETGTITAIATEGTPPYIYSLYDEANSLIISKPVPEAEGEFVVVGLSVGKYTLTVEDTRGCVQSKEVNIMEPNALQVSLVDANLLDDPLRCHYDVLEGDLEVVATGGTPDYTYRWFRTDWDDDVEGSTLSNVTAGTYLVTVIDANDCHTTESFVVQGPDPLKIDTLLVDARCRIAPEGDEGVIELIYLSGGNGSHMNDFDLTWHNDKGHLGSGDGRWKLENLQSGEYTVFITDEKSCVDTVLITLPFDQDNAYEIGIDMEDNYCWGASADLEAYPIRGSFGTGATFEWTNITQDINQTIGNGQSLITGTLTSTQIYRVRVVSDKGCLESRRDTVNVYSQIGPYLERYEKYTSEYNQFFFDEDLVAFEGDSTVITVMANNGYPVEIRTKIADSNLRYRWVQSDFFEPSSEKFSNLLFRTGQYESHLTGTLDNITTNRTEQYIPLTAYVTSEHNCVEEINLKARVLDRIRMPNVFSPNGDGLNDIWKVPYVNLFPDLEIKVVNRWGAVVWTARATDAAHGWDGKNKNGKDLPVGTYYYVINLNMSGNSGKWKPITGSVTIVR